MTWSRGPCGMRRLFAGAVVAAASLAFAASVHAGPGDLDPSFGGDGIVTTPFIGSSTARAVAQQPDGKLVVVGTASTPSDDSAFAVTRYNADGSLDGTFGEGGRVVTDLTGGTDVPSDVAIQPNGRIVVAGTVDFHEDEIPNDFALVRYEPDGSLDTGFGAGGSGGMVLTDMGGRDQADAIAVQPDDGKIVVAGSSQTNNNNVVDRDIVIARYHSGGFLDESFDGNGKQGVEFGTDEYAHGVAIQPDGRIVVAGYTDRGDRYRIAFARLNPNGGLDGGFDDDGRQELDFGAAALAKDVALQPDGKIVAAGRYQGSGFDFALARLNPDGSPDTGFNGVGFLATDLGGSEQGHAVAVQPDGNLVVAGSSGSNGVSRFALARYNPDGSLDQQFGGDGRVTTGSDGSLVGWDGLVQPDGKIVVAGYASDGTRSDFALARYGTTDDGGGGGDGTGDGTGDGGGEVVDTVAPELALRGRRSQRLGRFVKVRAGCGPEACALLARGSIVIRGGGQGKATAAKRRRFQLRRARAESAAGKVRLRLKLPRKARRAARRGLRRGHKVRARVVVIGTDAAGNRTKAKRRVKLVKRRR